MTFRFLSVTGVLLGALVLAGCDATDADPDPFTDASADEDAVVSIAAAIAVEGGGALDLAGGAAASAAAEEAGRSGPGPFDAGCTFELTYDAEAMLWSRFWQCERGEPGGPFYSLFSRTSETQYYDADGTPQADPETAVSAHFELLDGEGRVVRPWLRHELLDLGADLDLTDLDTDLVTVNGTHVRSATDTLRTFGGERTVVYDLALTYLDVRGPRGREWDENVSGTIEGQYDAVRTFDGPRGTVTEEISRTFTITFGEDGGEDVAYIRLGGETYQADLTTGEVEGLE
ncbi:MAG: hypothetical protein R3181_15820 [Rubricoccaceae bacterium]|nr:hypothetical protein [Rubricoccaceae bacterium]